MKASYNLIHQNWIICENIDQGLVKYNLKNLFYNLEKIYDLADPCPIVNASLLRFLVVLMIEIFNPVSINDLQKLFSDGLEHEKIIKYFNTFENRFDLFAKKYPFFQADDKRVRPKSVLKMIHHFSSGNNATLFDHHSEKDGITLQPDEAARYLIANQFFGLGGLSGIPEKFTNSPAQKGINFFIKGETLKETLLLNCFLYHGDKAGGIPLTGNDLPAWRMDDPFVSRNIPYGLKDYLTWLNRRIRLIPEPTENGFVVRRMTDGPGLRLDDSFIDGQSIRDPFHFYYQGSNSILPEKFSENKAIWRDSAALFSFETYGQRNLLAPEIVLHLQYLVNRKVISDQRLFRLSAMGMASDKAKILFYQQEELPIPVKYLENINLVRELNVMLELGENCSKKLFGALSVYARIAVDGNDNSEENGRLKKLSQDAEKFREHLGGDRFFWVEAQRGFLDLLIDLPVNEEGAKNNWVNHLRLTTLSAFDQAITFSGNSTRYQEAAVIAEKSLWFNLNEILGQKEVIE